MAHTDESNGAHNLDWWVDYHNKNISQYYRLIQSKSYRVDDVYLSEIRDYIFNILPLHEKRVTQYGKPKVVRRLDRVVSRLVDAYKIAKLNTDPKI